MIYTMAWVGTFNANFVGALHCGITPGVTEKNYEVAIKSKNLDKSGFVINNAKIDAYFEDLVNADVADSCELLCQHTAEFFVEQFKAEGRYPEEVYIKIWGLTDISFADCTWTRADDG